MKQEAGAKCSNEQADPTSPAAAAENKAAAADIKAEPEGVDPSAAAAGGEGAGVGPHREKKQALKVEVALEGESKAAAAEAGGGQQEQHVHSDVEGEVSEAPSQQQQENGGGQGGKGGSKAPSVATSPTADGLQSYRDKPRRKAAADAVVKMQHQRASQSGPFRNVTSEDGSAAAGGGGSGARHAAKGGDGGSGKGGGGGGGSGKAKKRKGGLKVPYVLPFDEVSGPWVLVADDREGFLELGEKLCSSSKGADREVGSLVLEAAEVLAERQEREAKYAKAHTRVMKALGLDQAAAAAEEGRRERKRKVINYAFDDYDKNMKVGGAMGVVCGVKGVALTVLYEAGSITDCASGCTGPAQRFTGCTAAPPLLLNP